MDKGTKVPVGHRCKGRGIDVLKETNTDTIIKGREFSGHALDQMQGRGYVPSIVEDVIMHPIKIMPGNKPDRTVYFGEKLKVILDKSGKVITVIHQ